MYLHRTSIGPVALAFTDRHGGVSRAPFDSLNLALAGADDPQACATNLATVVGDFATGAEVADMSQVHGSVVVQAHPGRRSEADALVTTRPGVVLVVRVADCVPVLLAAADGSCVAAVHAGRAGLAAGVVPAAVRRLRELGAAKLTAWVGPRVCGRCYEVPGQLRDEVAAVVPAAWTTSATGTPALDIGAGVLAQLAELDVASHDVGVCTRESPDLYSFRRDGARAGRTAGLITIREDFDGADR